MALVPRIEELLRLIPSGVSADFDPGMIPLAPKLKELLALKPVRLAPLCTCVMPEICQPFTNPPKSLFRAGFPSSTE